MPHVKLFPLLVPFVVLPLACKSTQAEVAWLDGEQQAARFGAPPPALAHWPEQGLEIAAGGQVSPHISLVDLYSGSEGVKLVFKAADPSVVSVPATGEVLASEREAVLSGAFVAPKEASELRQTTVTMCMLNPDGSQCLLATWPVWIRPRIIADLDARGQPGATVREILVELIDPAKHYGAAAPTLQREVVVTVEAEVDRQPPKFRVSEIPLRGDDGPNARRFRVEMDGFLPASNRIRGVVTVTCNGDELVRRIELQ